jgi:hypothetical protein
MKSIINKIMKKISALLVVLSIVLSSCSNEITLQKYFVERASNDEFISVNLPTSLLQLKEEMKDEQNMKALESFKRLNVLVFQQKDSSKVDVKAEVAQIKGIIANSNMKELMSMNMQGYYVEVMFTGDEDNIDEIVAFGTGKEGFVLGRIIGKDMNVKQVAKLASAIDFKNSNLSQLQNLNLK